MILEPEKTAIRRLKDEVERLREALEAIRDDTFDRTFYADAQAFARYIVGNR